MGKDISNVDLLLRAKESNAAAQELFEQFAGAPPSSPREMYALIKKLRDATRSASCAMQELKNRVKAKLDSKTVSPADNADNAD